jgi:hypothetical protein
MPVANGLVVHEHFLGFPPSKRLHLFFLFPSCDLEKFPVPLIIRANVHEKGFGSVPLPTRLICRSLGLSSLIGLSEQSTQKSFEAPNIPPSSVTLDIKRKLGYGDRMKKNTGKRFSKINTPHPGDLLE